MKISDLLENISYTLISGSLEIDISKISYDSRAVEKNSAFIAIRGFKVDGHIFISQAIEKGAKLIITEEEIKEINKDITYIKVKDTRDVLAQISCNFYNNPSSKCTVIGITGTNGKTSSSLILKNILESGGKKVGLIGTIGNYMGNEKREATLTTPESLEVQGLFAEMVKLEMDYIIMEVSSHALALKRVSYIEFDYGIFTNLSQDHLDFHKTIEEYFNEKKKLFYFNNIISIVNTDDSHGEKLYNVLKESNKKVISFGLKNENHIIAYNIDYSLSGVKFDFKMGELQEKMECPIPGKFTLYNLLGSIGAAVLEELPIENIKDALMNMPTVPGRIERLDINRAYDIILDFAHTPDGLENVLTTIKDHVKGRLITLFGCGGDRDKGKRPIMGKIAGMHSDFCIITSDNPRTESPELIIEDIIKGIQETDCPFTAIVNRKMAIKKALDMASSGDVIVLAGKGHETYQIIGEDKIVFNEKEIVKELLDI